ncbi:MAG: hypothetical protein CMN30_07340 [Sandaracinus sp.]|nr:hypothetical protein [Sandaracinus sp.]
MNGSDEMTRFVLEGPRFRPVELPGESGFVIALRGPVKVGDRALETGEVAGFSGRATVATRAVGARAVAFVRPVADSALEGRRSTAEVHADEVLARLAPLLANEHTANEVARPLAEAFAARLRELAGAASIADPIVRAAVRLAEGDELPSIVELAKRVGVSRASLVRRFRADVGESPGRYLTGVRLRRAAHRLLTTTDGLAAIAHDIGYASEFAFSRAFKRRYGVAPGIYRRSGGGSLRMCA